ncbi:aminodeoxychorismate synthase component I [Pseudohoeflea suaedae]|uniref:Aminodeoxychorismate synthase component I n=1 Tax=Pseudohoeflea suaedae TaxID=877384 RepID=A0A4R5PLZ9_9HYPH|nr:aminodeoxychorismate synthase component I [Pseudohoeflea suaedae]TDH36334.1 aminodeoxychorismate synthase component I [Pseudohoeflea suaedae]
MPPRRYVLFRDDLQARSTLFAEPREILVARTGAELAHALDRLEEARRDGFWSAGYLAYEAGYHLEPALADLSGDTLATPLLNFGIFDAPVDERDHPELIRPAADREAQLRDFAPEWDFKTYKDRFDRLHRHLMQGDIYQANLTFPIRARWDGRPLELFDALTARQPVRYGACIELDGPAIVSRSPELFFRVDEEGFVETHPMKGTAPRRTDPAADALEIELLRSSEKTLAENRMIVDLLRNDISRISRTGTLHEPSLFEVETYPTLHQMISRVRARLLPDLGIRDIFAALFPCGSITGAPKISAMRILHDLERKPREAYCGAIGFIAPGGTMRFSVAIRTLSLFENRRAVFNVGGGIVLDSDARAEYEEALLKARFAGFVA